MMFITFSGMVGSGKSTGAKRVRRWLTEWGYQPCSVRFRFLRWHHLLLPLAQQPWPAPTTLSSQERQPAPVYSSAQKRRCHVGKRLSLLKFIGYWLLIMRFRLFLALHFRDKLLILNRYFYDCFAGYAFSSKRERQYLHWLLAAMPKPDLAFLMVVRPETALQRRPAYDYDGLRQLAENYVNLQKYVGELVVIATDDVSEVDHHIKREVSLSFPPPHRSSEAGDGDHSYHYSGVEG